MFYWYLSQADQNIIGYTKSFNQEIEIAFTTAILNEYEEKIAEHWHPDIATNILRSLIELPTAHNVSVYFNLRVI